MVGVNLTGAFNICQAAAKRMARNAVVGGSRGSIVNIASLCARVGCQHVAAYSASKAGILALTRAMAVDLAPDLIRANAVVPGVFLTPLNSDMIKGTARGASILALTPAARFGSAAEITPAVVLLLSRESSFVNGSEIAVDGGYLATGISSPLCEVETP